jgi:hypothetical protein
VAVASSRLVDKARGLLAHEHAVAAALLFVVVLIELWPALVEGRLLSPTSLLYGVPPWQGYAPGDISHYLNPLLVDVPYEFYPWDTLARALIHHGTFPAWNPYALAGTPLFANSQVAWFSPFSLPLWILPLNYAFGVAAALKLWMAGFGTYLLVRELRLGLWPGIVAGISFMLCAFNVEWMTHGVQLSVAALLPWTVWLTERVVRRGRAWDGLALVGATAFALSGGHPGTEVHLVAAVAVYAIVRTFAVPELTRRERWGRLAMVGGAVLLGALLLAVTIVPTLREIPGTAGGLARANGAPTLPGSTMPASILKTILFPDWWGRPNAIYLGGPANYNERTLYAGALAVLLAAVGLLLPGSWRRKAPLAVLAVIGLAAPLDVQPLHAILDHVPPFDSVQNQRLLLLFLFAVAVLAAFGTQAVLEAPSLTRRTGGVMGAGLAVGAFAILSLAPSGHALAQTVSHFATGAEHASAQVIELTSVVWWLLLTLGLTAVVLARARWRRFARYAPVLLVVLVAVDMLHFAHGYQPMGPPSKAIPPRTSAVLYLQAHTGDGRVAGLGGSLANDWTTVYGVRDVRGYDPPEPSLRFYHLWRLLDPQQTGWQPLAISVLSPPGMRLLEMLGTRYLVAGPGVSGEFTRLASVLKRRPGQLPVVYDGPDATIAADTRALPRAMIARSIRLVNGEAGILAALGDGSFDPRTQVLVEAGAPGAQQLAADSSGGGSVEVTRDANAQVSLRASLAHPGLVMLDDQIARGWTVRVDGRPATALTVDGVMRGVAVPAGTHAIVWNYTVPGLRLGLVLSGLGLIGILIWATIAWILPSHRRHPPGRAFTRHVRASSQVLDV